MKVAIIHDWLTGLRGGERCLQAFLKLYPEADLYTLVHVPGTTDAVIDAHVKQASFLNKIPYIGKTYRVFLPFYPMAIKGFNLEGYDLVISLSHAAAKNVRVPKGVRHICYCFTPMRYIWDQTYKYFGKSTPLIWPLIRSLRRWDKEGAAGVSDFVAISRFVAARIRCFYGASAHVIFPPVDTSWIRPAEPGMPGKAFLYAGALVPYKRPDLVVRAFNQIREPLWVVGSGPEEAKLREIARTNIRFMGRVSDDELARFYRHCRALVFPGKEDFGMVPVECMAAGRPVISLYDGALKETNRGLKVWSDYSMFPVSEATGVFIEDTKAKQLESLISAIRYFIKKEPEFRVEACIAQAKKYGLERFERDWKALVNYTEQRETGIVDFASAATA